MTGMPKTMKMMYVTIYSARPEVVKGLKLSICTFLSTIFTLSSAMSAKAQIDFGIKTENVLELEERVNKCAAEQTISVCFSALSRAHVMQISYADTEYDAERIMRNAVILLPLHMLAQLYEREGRDDVSCGFAQSGERQLHKLLADIDRLMAKDPTAFKNIDKTKNGLKDVQDYFDKVLKNCD